ncbi:hypothetical protein J4405_00655 [Candidatus Woesearchaeota archaeon]|nr:hypothetical protein [Candidatus Woesearchaeota archaeon]
MLNKFGCYSCPVEYAFVWKDDATNKLITKTTKGRMVRSEFFERKSITSIILIMIIERLSISNANLK